MAGKSRLLWCFLSSVSLFLIACSGGGGGSAPAAQASPNPTPSVSSISPSSVSAGAADTTVTITGSNFIATSVANLNGQSLKTAFVSGTQLTAVIPQGNLASGAIDNITVSNPPPGGGVSASSIAFTVNNPKPTVTQISPTAIPSGTAATVTATGSNFVPTSQITLDGQNLQTSFISSGKLQATVPASPAVLAGNHSVAVVNSGPGGGTSGNASLAVSLTLKVFQTTALWAPSSTNDIWAQVSGGATGTITWSIQEGSAGGQLFVNDVFDSSLNVRKMGYIAPSVPGTYHVVAQSSDDPSQQAQATITVATNAEVFKRTTGNPTVNHQIDFSATKLADGSSIPPPCLEAARF